MDKLSLSINGHHLHIEQGGPVSGAPVILLHHGLGSVRAWRRQISTLAHAGFRVIAYDRWGYGRSDGRSGLDLPTFTDDLTDLNALFEQLRIQRAALVGHSDGGTIALYFAAQQPERVSCLVTIAAHIYVNPKMEPELLNLRQAFETKQRFRKGMKRSHGDKFESVFYNWFDGWHRAESLSWDMRQVLARIECPVLVVQGEDDEHATPQHARDICRSIPKADLWILPRAKHMLPQKNAVEFNAKILPFLKNCATNTE